MERKNEHSKLMGICHKFLNSFSRTSAFRRLQHHIRNQSSHCDSKLMPVAHCEGSTMVMAKNAATCDVDHGKEIMVEPGIHIVRQNDLYSEIEDEPYLVSHEEASSAYHPVKGKPCDKDAALPRQTTLVGAGMEGFATQFESHVEENGESHWKEEAVNNAATNAVQSKSHHSSSQQADAENDQSENAGGNSLTPLQNETLREESTLRDDSKADKGSDSGFTVKVTEAKIGEQGQVEMTDSKQEHKYNGKQQTSKSVKPSRPMRRSSGQNERPSVLIKRRRTTRRAGLASCDDAFHVHMN